MPENDLEYHRSDALQEFDRHTDKTRNELAEEEHKKHFSPRIQWWVFCCAVIGLALSIIKLSRYGMAGRYSDWRSYSPLTGIAIGLVLAFFSLSNIRKHKR